jgi:ribonuclease P protein component
MRFSQANEDCQRASNHQPPSSERSQAALRLKQRFPKSVRLRTRQEFRRLQREGKRLQGLFLVFQIASENFNCPRLGITVSKQFGSAVSRNLFKRRIREVFRREKHRLPPGLKVHVSPRHGAGQPTLAQVKNDFSLVIDTVKSLIN